MAAQHQPFYRPAPDHSPQPLHFLYRVRAQEDRKLNGQVDCFRVRPQKFQKIRHHVPIVCGVACAHVPLQFFKRPYCVAGYDKGQRTKTAQLPHVLHLPYNVPVPAPVRAHDAQHPRPRFRVPVHYIGFVLVWAMAARYFYQIVFLIRRLLVRRNVAGPGNKFQFRTFQPVFVLELYAPLPRCRVKRLHHADPDYPF